MLISPVYVNEHEVRDIVIYDNYTWENMYSNPRKKAEEIDNSIVDDSLYIVEGTRFCTYDFDLDEADILELATLVYLEVGIESYECQQAVASVVLNRMFVEDESLQSIIYADNQFTPASKIATSSPSESTLNATKDVIENGTTIPIYVTFFRSDHYHNWGSRYENYKCIDNTYFSYDTYLMSKYNN
jgi:spore germination cell wall hydrolase CwlJ-like protein